MEEQEKKPQVSDMAAGGMFIVALLADGAAILLDFVYLGWTVTIFCNVILFPFWFRILGIKYDKTDVMASAAGLILSFIPVFSFLPEITANVAQKILRLRITDTLGKVAGKLAGLSKNPLVKIALNATPQGRVAKTGIDIAQKTGVTDRIEKKEEPWGTRREKTGGAPMVGDSKIPQSKPTSRVGAEIRPIQQVA